MTNLPAYLDVNMNVPLSGDAKPVAHTPGPWRFLEEGRTEEDGNACRPLTICGPADDDLAQVFSEDDSTVNVTREQAIGNARLMACAPELLEALRRLEVSANTVARCYTHRPENFASALQQLADDAETARALHARAAA